MNRRGGASSSNMPSSKRQRGWEDSGTGSPGDGTSSIGGGRSTTKWVCDYCNVSFASYVEACEHEKTCGSRKLSGDTASQALSAAVSAAMAAAGDSGVGSNDLVTSSDRGLISELDYLLCRNVELFSASEEDVRYSSYSYSICGSATVVGQMGLRCMHCSRSPLARAGFASVFPGSVASIGLSLKIMGEHHFKRCGLCPTNEKDSIQRAWDERDRGDTDERSMEEFCVKILANRMGITNLVPSKTGVIFTSHWSPQHQQTQQDTDAKSASAGVAYGQSADPSSSVSHSSEMQSQHAHMQPLGRVAPSAALPMHRRYPSQPQQINVNEDPSEMQSKVAHPQPRLSFLTPMHHRYSSQQQQIQDDHSDTKSQLTQPLSRLSSLNPIHQVYSSQRQQIQKDPSETQSQYTRPLERMSPYISPMHHYTSQHQQIQKYTHSSRPLERIPSYTSTPMHHRYSPPNRETVHSAPASTTAGSAYDSTSTRSIAASSASSMYSQAASRIAPPLQSPYIPHASSYSAYSPSVASHSRYDITYAFIKDSTGWSCRYCSSLPFHYRAPGSVSQTMDPPSRAFIEQHLSLCQGMSIYTGPQHQRLHHYSPPTVPSQSTTAAVEYLISNTPAQTSTSLVLQEDKSLLTDYFFYLIQQLRLCRFSESDRKTRGGKRENVKIGFGGLECCHCANANPNSSRKFFWSNVDRLANSFAEIPSHVLKCRNCDQGIKNSLMVLKFKHPEQMAKLPRGSQKVFFRRMWRRVHMDTEENTSKSDSTEVSTIKPQPSQEESTEIRQSPTQTYLPVLLAIPEDKDWLSDTDCFVRRNLQVFCATEDDLAIAHSDRKYPICLNQVGIRCLHCAQSSKGARGNAVSFPYSIDGIYESVRELQKLHLELCPNLPQNISTELTNLKTSTSLSSVLRRYYVLAAKALGMVDTQDGIRLGGEATTICSSGTLNIPSMLSRSTSDIVKKEPTSERMRREEERKKPTTHEQQHITSEYTRKEPTSTTFRREIQREEGTKTHVSEGPQEMLSRSTSDIVRREEEKSTTHDQHSTSEYTRKEPDSTAFKREIIREEGTKTHVSEGSQEETKQQSLETDSRKRKYSESNIDPTSSKRQSR